MAAEEMVEQLTRAAAAWRQSNGLAETEILAELRRLNADQVPEAELQRIAREASALEVYEGARRPQAAPRRAPPRASVVPIARAPEARSRRREAPAAPRPVERLETIRLDTVQPCDVLWMFEPYLPLGMLTMLDGDPGAGKTAAAYDLMARITMGAPMPLETRERTPQRALILCAEDTPEHVIVPRLLAAGADLSRVELVPGTWSAEAVEALGATIRRMGDVGYLHVDAIMNAMGGDTDTGRDNAIRALLNPLAELAARLGFAVTLGRHLAKAAYEKALYAGLASIGFNAVARSALLAGPNPDDPKAGRPNGERLLAHVKTNVGAIGKSLRFRLDLVPVPGLSRPVPRVEWLGFSDRTANDVAQWKPEGDARGAARIGAAAFLARYFAARESAPASEVMEAAKAEGLEPGDSAWRRARQDLGIASHQRDGGWVWQRPAGAAAPPLDADDPLRG